MRQKILLAAAMVAGSLVVGGVAAKAQDNTQQPGPTVEIYNEADAQAVLNARLAALKTVLELTPDQEKLWAPVEESIRKMAGDAAARRKQRETAEPPSDFLDVFERIADAEAARAADLKAFVAASRPLVAVLTDQQKMRAPAFLGMFDNPDAPQPTGELWFFEEEQG